MTSRLHAEAEQCVRLVMEALVKNGGDHAIIRSGRVPVMTRDAHAYRMSSAPVPRAAVAEMARCLLPKEMLRALVEIGETRYHLPHRPATGADDFDDFDDFIVDVTDKAGDICVDIEHHSTSLSDDIPLELFQQP